MRNQELPPLRPECASYRRRNHNPRVLLTRHAQRRFDDQPVAFAFHLLSSIYDGMIERFIVHREATRVL